jgi:3-hydroxypropanoate dehydrogenase
MAAPLSDEALDLLFRKARSYNGYLDRPVSEDQLRQIWELMKMGPTSANFLPLRIVWCVSAEAKQKLSTVVKGNNAQKVLNAPVTAILAMDMQFYDHSARLFPIVDLRSWFVNEKEEVNEAYAYSTAFRNSTLQGGYFILSARAIGLDTGPMSGFDHEGVDQAFFTGTSYRSNFLCTLGYGDPTTIFERMPRPTFEEFTMIA